MGMLGMASFFSHLNGTEPLQWAWVNGLSSQTSLIKKGPFKGQFIKVLAVSQLFWYVLHVFYFFKGLFTTFLMFL